MVRSVEAANHLFIASFFGNWIIASPQGEDQYRRTDPHYQQLILLPRRGKITSFTQPVHRRDVNANDKLETHCNCTEDRDPSFAMGSMQKHSSRR